MLKFNVTIFKDEHYKVTKDAALRTKTCLLLFRNEAHVSRVTRLTNAAAHNMFYDRKPFSQVCGSSVRLHLHDQRYFIRASALSAA